MNDIAYLKEMMQQLDAERIRVTKELEKRRHDLKMHADKMGDQLIKAEKAKISQLQDILEDVEYDLTSVVDDLFDEEGQSPLDVIDEILAWPTETPDPKRKEELEERYRKAENDLEQYKLQAEKLKAELLTLDTVIEETEEELQDLCADIAELE